MCSISTFVREVFIYLGQYALSLSRYYKIRKQRTTKQTHYKRLTFLPENSRAVRDEDLGNSFPRFLVGRWLSWLGGTVSSSPVRNKSAHNNTTSVKTCQDQLQKTYFCSRPDRNAYRRQLNDCPFPPLLFQCCLRQNQTCKTKTTLNKGWGGCRLCSLI